MTDAPPDDSAPSILGATTRSLVGILSLLLPFVFWPTLADPFRLPKEVLFRGASVLVLGTWLAGILVTGRVSFRRLRVAAPLLLLVFLSLLSIFQAPNPGEAASAARDVTLCALLLILLVPALTSRPRPVAAGLGLAAALTSLLGCLQLLADPSLRIFPATQGGVLVGDVSTSAIFVALLLPMLTALAFSSAGRSRWAWAAAAGLAAGYLVLARTRAAWLGAAAGMGLLGLLALKRRWGTGGGLETGRPPAPGGPSVLAVALGLALFLVGVGVIGAGIQPVAAAPSVKVVELQGLEMRLATWRATMQMILGHPLGVGASNWRYAFPGQAGNLEPRTPFTISRFPFQAGNEYLETAAEIGLAGLLLLLWLLFRLLASGWRAAEGGAPRLTDGATAGVGGLAVAGLLSSPLREQPTLWTALILAALVLAGRASSEGAQRDGEVGLISWEFHPPRRRILTALIGIFFLALAGIAGYDGYRSLSASVSLKEGQSACLRRDYGVALPALLRAGRLDPSSFAAHFLAGACAYEARQLDLAEAQLRLALRENPYDGRTLLSLASTLKARGSYLEAVAVGEKVQKIWPADARVRLALGEMRESVGDMTQAVRAYSDAIQRDPSLVQAYLRLGVALEKQDQLTSAVAAYSRAVELDPFLPEGLYRLAGGYLRQGINESAVRAFEQLLALTPDSVETLVGLSRAYRGLERYCQALPLLEKARDREKDSSRRAGIERALEDVRSKCRRPSGGET